MRLRTTLKDVTNNGTIKATTQTAAATARTPNGESKSLANAILSR